MLTANEIVKEQMIQTTSKKIVRSFEQKPSAYVPRTHNIRIEGLCGLRLAWATLQLIIKFRKLCLILYFLK